ncbi:MAG: hypothetical protein ABI383_08465 [Acidobacteriaceae bacterium]
MAFTYRSTTQMELAEWGRVELRAPLSDFFPDLPDANRTTVKNLANMASGLCRVHAPEFAEASN